MSRYIEGDLKEAVRQSKEGEFLSVIPGDCWKVKKYKDCYYFQFLSGELAGKTKIIKISEADYLMCIDGNRNQNQLCIKFGIS